MEKEKGSYKLTDSEFLEALTTNRALYAQTAKWIESKYSIKFSRQAVAERAKGLSDGVLNSITDGNLDFAEGNIHDLMNSKNELVKLKANQYYLNNKGKKRGYNTKEGEEKGELVINWNVTKTYGNPSEDPDISSSSKQN